MLVASIPTNSGTPLNSGQIDLAPGWQRGARYSDAPVTLGNRLAGIGGIAALALSAAGVTLVSWSTYRVIQEPETLSVFDVAEPSAPPEPRSETPPGPEEVQKDEVRQEVETARPEPVLIQLASNRPVAVATPRPAVDPGPPAPQTTAPESKPLPPAPRASTGKPSWDGQLLAALNRSKRYPREANFLRQQGVPWIRFVINRDGNVISSKLERSSGVRSLDDEAVALPKRAQPLPKPPAEVEGETIERVVPVEFFLK